MLGLAYANAVGVKEDLKAPFKWVARSGNGGYALAQNELGSMFALGQGTLRLHVRLNRE
jgi:TPR repeat protein